MSNQLKFIFLYGISGALVWLFILPSYNGSGKNILNRESLTKKYEDQKKAEELKEKAKTLSETGKQLAQQYASFKDSDKKRLLTAMPPGVDIVRALNEITAITESSKIELKSISYGENDGENNKNKLYIPVTFNIGVSSSYDQIYNYIEKLQDNLRIFNIKSIDIRSSKVENKIDASIVFSTFYFDPNASLVDISRGNEELSTLESVINSYVFKEVDAILGLSKKLGNKIQINPLVSELVDTTILIDRQIVTQKSNPFIYKF